MESCCKKKTYGYQTVKVSQPQYSAMVALNPPVEMPRRPDELIILPLNEATLAVTLHESVALVRIQYEFVNPRFVDSDQKAQEEGLMEAVYRCPKIPGTLISNCDHG